MAPPKNNFDFAFSGNFFSQILFALFLTLIFQIANHGQKPALSIFLGVLGGVALGWITAANKTGPNSPTVASSEGIDAGLRYWLLFLLGFMFLKYQAPMSILLGAIAGVGGGWIVAWWGSKEEIKTQLPSEDLNNDEVAVYGERYAKRQKRPITRIRRRRGRVKFRFWER